MSLRADIKGPLTILKIYVLVLTIFFLKHNTKAELKLLVNRSFLLLAAYVLKEF